NVATRSWTGIHGRRSVYARRGPRAVTRSGGIRGPLLGLRGIVRRSLTARTYLVRRRLRGIGSWRRRVGDRSRRRLVSRSPPKRKRADNNAREQAHDYYGADD